MGRRTYSDSDRALVFTELEVNDGNIKRTARNLGIPVSTIRYFKDQWQKEGELVLPSGVQAALPAILEERVEGMERVQGKMLVKIEEGVDEGTIKGKDLLTGFGIFTDKIRALKGLDSKKVEHTFELPNPEEVRALFGGVVQELVGAARDRAAEIEDAEWEPAEPIALPPAQEVSSKT
jgi:transposase-like protein